MDQVIAMTMMWMGGVFFGHSTAKYARNKRMTRWLAVAGIVIAIIAASM